MAHRQPQPATTERHWPLRSPRRLGGSQNHHARFNARVRPRCRGGSDSRLGSSPPGPSLLARSERGSGSSGPTPSSGEGDKLVAGEPDRPGRDALPSVTHLSARRNGPLVTRAEHRSSPGPHRPHTGGHLHRHRGPARGRPPDLPPLDDPEIIASIEHTAGHVEGVQRVGVVRACWIGHRLAATIAIVVGEDLRRRRPRRGRGGAPRAAARGPPSRRHRRHVDTYGHHGVDRQAQAWSPPLSSTGR